MKRQIRVGVFETNSSSTHSLTICTKEEYEDWRAGKYILDNSDWGSTKLRLPEQLEMPDGAENALYTYEQWAESIEEDFSESFKKEFTTPSGDNMVAFGYYGYDG